MTQESRERAVDIEDPAAPVVAEEPVQRNDAVRMPDSSGRAEADNSLHDDVELVPSDTRRDFEMRWREIQAMFVDDPRAAVQQADGLVGEVAQALTASFSQRKAGLEQHAGPGGEPETEELRQALRSYRALFERVLRI